MKDLQFAVDLWIEKMKEYLCVPSVVGYEHPFMNKLQEDFKALGLTVERHDRYLHIQGNDPQGFTLSAHIDRHGLISNGHGELEYAAYRVEEMKYNEEKKVIESMWDKIRERFIDEEVYAYDPEQGYMICKGQIYDCYICEERDNFVFQVTTLVDLPENIPVSFSPASELNEEMFKGQIDNAISVALAFTLYSLGFQGNLMLTTEEEIGKSWTYLLDYLQGKPETHNLIVLDTSPFDHEKFEEVNMNSVVLRKQDASGSFNVDLAESTALLASQNHIPFVFKDDWIRLNATEENPHLGHTELGHLATESNGKYNGITIQIPTINYHTNEECASLGAMYNVLKILTLMTGITTQPNI